jgi:glyoxalase family protein
MKEILGIHHVTAIAGDPQRNLDFYTNVLGLRLVKLTVNFDDPSAYHLYYGDEVGHPGTILTFFAWPDAPHGRRGTQQATAISFSIPENALGYWMERFRAHDVAFEKPIVRPDEEALVFFDPDGLQLELVAHEDAEARDPWRDGPVPGERAIRGFYSVTLSEQRHERTASLLIETLGFRFAQESGERLRYKVNHGGAGAMVDVLRRPHGIPGGVAVGSVHHVAWRTPDDEQQLAWRQEIGRAGLDVTRVMDRQYFHSIYFREPGGVLFEIATDPPGFTVDEALEQLGTQLRLPPWLEPMRADIERGLPPVRVRQMVPER